MGAFGLAESEIDDGDNKGQEGGARESEGKCGEWEEKESFRGFGKQEKEGEDNQNKAGEVGVKQGTNKAEEMVVEAVKK